MNIRPFLDYWVSRTLLVLAMLGMPAIVSGFQTTDLIPVDNGSYSNWASNDSLTGDYSDVTEGPGCTPNAFFDYWVRIPSGGNARQSATLNLSSIPNGTTITAIGITVCANDGLSSLGTFRTFTRINGSNSDAAADITVPLTISGTPYTQNIALNVAKTAGTAVEVGVRKGNNLTVSIGTLSAVISYRATPTLLVTNSPVTYNGLPQAATVQANSDVPAPNTVVPGTVNDVKYDGSSTIPTNAGTYAITADFAPTNTGDYNSLSDAAAGNFVIAKADQTITFGPNPGPVTYTPSGTFPVGATASSTLAVTFTSTTTGVCTISGSTVTMVTAGLCTIAADQAGDSNYNAASTATQDILTIAKAATTTVITSDTPDPSLVNQEVTVNFAVTTGNGPAAAGATVQAVAPGPTGDVTVTVTGPVNSNSCMATLPAGSCTLPGTDFPQPGSYTLTATYAGDTNFNTSFGTASHQVNQLGPVGGGAAIPTLQEWALILMGLLFGGLVWRQSRRTGRMEA